MIHKYCDEIFDITLLNPLNILLKKLLMKQNLLQTVKYFFNNPENCLESGLADIFEEYNIRYYWSL